MTDDLTINHVYARDARNRVFRPCIWCGGATDVEALPRFLPGRRVPLHLMCGAELRDAYRLWRGDDLRAEGMPQSEWDHLIKRLATMVARLAVTDEATYALLRATESPIPSEDRAVQGGSDWIEGVAVEVTPRDDPLSSASARARVTKESEMAKSTSKQALELINGGVEPDAPETLTTPVEKRAGVKAGPVKAAPVTKAEKPLPDLSAFSTRKQVALLRAWSALGEAPKARYAKMLAAAEKQLAAEDKAAAADKAKAKAAKVAAKAAPKAARPTATPETTPANRPTGKTGTKPPAPPAGPHPRNTRKPNVDLTARA